MFRFEQLRVYQQSLFFIDDMFTISQQFPKSEGYCVTDQLRRASLSIALNIAEGSSRTKKDFSHFLSLSRGSCNECIALLTIAFTRKYVSEQQYRAYYDKCKFIAQMLSALKVSLTK